MDKGIQVDSVYTDFRKAFDKVDHYILLKKIAFNGIRGDLLRWFHSYITKRTQRVVVNGHSSNLVTVISGVPQGSILGPLLFILFINDINNCFHHSHFLLYADDLKVYLPILSADDNFKLQSDLYRLSLYCTKNKLQLNVDKCKSITFTKKRNLINNTYTINNTEWI
ncbi:unnamed protein product [Parnassius mnemosyne]|uniref:Reverse transcriptase domain-containing protein n=1 Tax=Parnassius mnemosyne TaxID=213953 RepID=A0AAV1KG76_9NEOP